MARGRRTSEDRIRKLLARYRSSGMTQRAFARAHSVPLSTLTYWLRRYPATENALVPVRLSTAPQLAAGIEIVLPNEAVVRVVGDCDPELLSTVLRTVSSTC